VALFLVRAPVYGDATDLAERIASHIRTGS